MRLYTPEEAAILLHVAPRTIRNWCHKGKLKYRLIKRNRGIIRWKEIRLTDDDLKEFVDAVYAPPLK